MLLNELLFLGQPIRHEKDISQLEKLRRLHIRQSWNIYPASRRSVCRSDSRHKDHHLKDENSDRNRQNQLFLFEKRKWNQQHQGDSEQSNKQTSQLIGKKDIIISILDFLLFMCNELNLLIFSF